MPIPTPPDALRAIADQIEARAITEQPLTIAETLRLSVLLRSIALVQAARLAADQVEAALLPQAERCARQAEGMLAAALRPPGAIAAPLPADAAPNVLAFPRRHRAHADHLHGDGHVA